MNLQSVLTFNLIIHKIVLHKKWRTILCMLPSILVLFFLSTTYRTNAQHYKMIESVNTDLVISKNVDLYDIHYKFYNKYLFLFQVKRFEQDSSNVTVTVLDITSGKIIDTDTIPKLHPEFRITDLLVTNECILIVSDDTYIIKRGHSIFTYNNIEKKRFQYCRLLSNNSVLLYLIYNFHPADGIAGLHMYTLNLENNIITNGDIKEFNPVILSVLNSNWLATHRNNIMVVSPLIGTLAFFDSAFENTILYDSINVFSPAELARNIKINHYLDSLFIEENGRLCSKIKTSNKGELKKPLNLQSIIYTKDYVWKIVDTIRKNYSFIERIFNINDSIIATTVSRPGYNYIYRDLYYYNINTKTIVSVFNKWLCLPTDKINSAEDFFTINIILGATRNPYFKNNNEVYFVSMYNPDLLINGLKDEVTKLYLKDINQNNYRINILRYVIKSDENYK